MNNYIDWTEMDLAGNLFELPDNFADMPKRIMPLLSNSEDEFYSTDNFPTIKNVMHNNEVDLPDGSVRYAVDVTNDGSCFVRLELEEEAFTWKVITEEEEFSIVPVGVTPKVILYRDRGKRLSQGEINSIEDEQPEEIIKFVLRELS